MKSLKIFVGLLAIIFATAGNSPAVAEDTPDWITGVQAVEDSAKRHLAAIDLVLAEQSTGNINPESLAELTIAHNKLASALTTSADLINKKQTELIEVSIACMKSQEALSDKCQKKIDAMLVFSDWAIEAIALQGNLALGLILSESLLGNKEKSL